MSSLLRGSFKFLTLFDAKRPIKQISENNAWNTTTNACLRPNLPTEKFKGSDKNRINELKMKAQIPKCGAGEEYILS